MGDLVALDADVAQHPLVEVGEGLHSVPGAASSARIANPRRPGAESRVHKSERGRPVPDGFPDSGSGQKAASLLNVASLNMTISFGRRSKARPIRFIGLSKQKPPLRRLVIRRATSKEIAEGRSAAYKACLVTRRMIIAPYSFVCLCADEFAA